MEFWCCKNCEHKNKSQDVLCEICGSKRPVLKSYKYELSEIFGVVKIYWETDNADNIAIVKKEKKFEVGPNGLLLLDGCKNNEKIILYLNNKFAEYQEELVIFLEKPKIILFELDSVKLLTGNFTQIKWKVNNSTTTQIIGIGKVDYEGLTNLQIKRSPVKIIAENEIGTIEKEIEVEFIPLPQIEFNCKQKIELGDILHLKWRIENALKSVLLYNEVETVVENIGEKEVALKEKTSFRLIVTALDNKTIMEKVLIIEVFPKPEIKLFEISPEVVVSSQPVTLSWKVENAKKIEINNGVGKVREEGKKIVSHDKNTLYQLTVWGELSSVTKEIVLKVFPIPLIESLVVPMPDFESQICLNPLKINSPKIDVAIIMPDFNIELLNFNLTTPKFIVPSDGFLKSYKSQLSFFHLSKIHKYIKNYVRKRIKL